MGSRARDAIERFGSGESEELPAEVSDGLQIEARRRAGIIIACQRDRAARFEQRAHGRSLRQIEVGNRRRTGDGDDTLLRDGADVVGTDVVTMVDGVDTQARGHLRGAAVGHLVAMHAQAQAVQTRCVQVPARLFG